MNKLLRSALLLFLLVLSNTVSSLSLSPEQISIFCTDMGDASEMIMTERQRHVSQATLSDRALRLNITIPVKRVVLSMVKDAFTVEIYQDPKLKLELIEAFRNKWESACYEVLISKTEIGI